ncbi:MAG TPA: hypothetical protein VNO23_07570, partial [Candidatus Binatia bacterium]|nr:hypothetical protein [Candidatus Binatia bacterium]
MAGNFAKIYNSIWADPEFRDLTRGRQWLYFTLISQPELNIAGVLTTTERRITGCAADFTVDELHEDLAALQDRAFILIDEEHDEIFVRTYIKWDDQWRTPNVLIGILRAATMVRSPRIRAQLAIELSRLDLSLMDGKRAEEMRRRVAETVALLTPRVPTTLPGRVVGTVTERVTATVTEGFQQPFPEPLGEPFLEVVVDVVDEVKDRTSVTVGQDQQQEGPDPSDPVASGDGAPDSTPAKIPRVQPGSDQDPDFAAFWDAYPRKVGKPSACRAWKKAIKAGADPSDIVAAV